MSKERRNDGSGSPQSWMWDYFSIKDDAIYMSVCDVCGEEHRHIICHDDLYNMKRHLFNKHIYKETKTTVIHWESHFERVQCSTDSMNGNIKCKHCTEYNDILLRVSKGITMGSHLKKEHYVTKYHWKYLEKWRDEKTKDYYDLTQEDTESIKRTRLCKKCGHHFRRSNLIIMVKHLMQVHNLIPDVPSDKIPKGLLQLNVDASSSQNPSISSRSDSSLQESANLLMAELTNFMDKYEQ